MDNLNQFISTEYLWLYLLIVVVLFALHVYSYPSAIDFFDNPDSSTENKNSTYPVE
jgi:hypothetical protein